MKKHATNCVFWDDTHLGYGPACNCGAKEPEMKRKCKTTSPVASAIGKAIEEFYTEWSPGNRASELLKAIFRHPVAAVIKEYVAYYSEHTPDQIHQDWHFRWVFEGFPLTHQLRLVEEAIAKKAEKRKPFDKRLFAESRLLRLLSVPDDSQRKMLFKILAFGWDYYIDICNPAQESRERGLAEIVAHIRSILPKVGSE